MRVTGLEQAGKAKCRVYIDGEFAFVLYKGELPHYQLKEGEEIAPGTLQAVREEVLLPRAKRRALYLLNEMGRTEEQLRRKLSADGYPADVTEAALDYVKSYGYVNDDAYIRSFADSRRRTKSRREIRMLLEQKGLDREQIDRVLDPLYQEEGELDTIRKLLTKRGWDPEAADAKERERNCAYLLRKGFRFEDIREAMRE